MSKKIKPQIPRPQEMMTGAEACAHAAAAAGCQFFATTAMPFTADIAAAMVRRGAECPGIVNMYADTAQAAVAMTIGASLAGKKAMAAVYGVESILESLSFAVSAEIPCVVMAIGKASLCAGQPTRITQESLSAFHTGMLAGRVILLYPWSASEVFDCTVKAFCLSELYRVPVIIFCDSLLCSLYEKYKPSKTPEPMIRNMTTGQALFGRPNTGLCMPLPPVASGARLCVTADPHTSEGYNDTLSAQVMTDMQTWLFEKINTQAGEIAELDCYDIADAEQAVVSVGLAARSSLEAIRIARNENIRVGLIRLITVNPVHTEKLSKVMSVHIKRIIVPEMNTGLLAAMVRSYFPKKEVISLARVDGALITPECIITQLKEQGPCI